MSTYINQDEKITFEDKFEIKDIKVDKNLKVIMIDNRFNLKKIDIPINENLYVSIKKYLQSYSDIYFL